ncbi:MAG: nucleotidyltransferase family protein [Terrimicrobiaceae bacterium]
MKVLPSNNCKAGLFSGKVHAEAPGQDTAALERVIEQQKIWLMLMLSQASLAVKALREAGIPCLMLKGGAGLLAGWLKVERHPVTDIDILIAPERLEEAARILTAKGWSPAFRPYLPCDARRHSHPVSSPGGGLLVDIHWFSLRHARWPGVDDVLWQGAWRAKLFDGDVLIPSPEDFLVHTVAHGRRAGSPGSLWRKDLRTLLGHPGLSVDWDRVERTVQNYRVAPMVAAALEEVRAEAPDCVSEQICRRFRRLPAPLSDRFFLQLVRRFPEEVGFGHAVIVGLDFFRTRPCSFRELPRAFVKYLKDRWELSSPRQVPVRFVEVILWGLQVELGKFLKRLRGTIGFVRRNTPRQPRRPTRKSHPVHPVVRGARARILIGICSCVKNHGKRRAVRETWGRQIPHWDSLKKRTFGRAPAGATGATFFVGNGGAVREEGLIVVDEGDEYWDLMRKVHAFFKIALEDHDFDWLFKCDDDTYVAVERLRDLTEGAHEHAGNGVNKRGAASGGAGYLLSRRLVEALAYDFAPPHLRLDEDLVFSGKAAQLCGRPLETRRLGWNNKVIPRASNDQITAHYMTPNEMRTADSLFRRDFGIA